MIKFAMIPFAFAYFFCVRLLWMVDFLCSTEYKRFITDKIIVSIDKLCPRDVEAFHKESDHLLIIAVSKTLDIPIKLLYSPS